MAVVSSCSSVRCSCAALLSSAPNFSKHSPCVSHCSVEACGVRLSTSVRESGGESVSFSASSLAAKHYGVCGARWRASGDFATSPGGASHQGVPSSSGWGSGGSLLALGDCGNGTRTSWNALVRRKSSRRRRNVQHRDCSRAGMARSRTQEEAAVVKDIADLSANIMSLKSLVASEYRAIGPEMRGRVDRLYDRAIVLQQSADRVIESGSRIPTQMAANLIALQREHGSLENIVRLAMEASPALTNLEAAVSRNSALSEATTKLLLEEKEKPKASAFQSLVRESEIVKQSAPAPRKYVMSASAAQGSSPLAAFRAEIERRVIEQLSGKKMKKPEILPSPESSRSDSSLQSSQQLQLESRLVDGKQGLADKLPEALEETSGQLSTPSTEEAAEKVTVLEKKLKQVEIELAKSIPLQIFEQKVGKISTALSEARAEVTQLSAEVAEKEAILTALKKEMLAEQDQLTQKVRELTGDLEKMYSVEDIEDAVNFGLQDLEKDLEEEQDRTFLLTIELEKKEIFLAEQQEKWRIMKEELEEQLEKEQERSLSLSLELEKKEKLLTEQEELWKVQRVALEKEQEQALSLSLELAQKEKVLTEQEETWKAERLALEADIKAIQLKLQDVRKKRTKERAQLAEKKQKVKLLEQELTRLQESMEEADRVRLKKKEATCATVRMLITQMVQSSRARAESEAHANSLVQEVAKLQEENQVLEHSTRSAEAKASQADKGIEGIKSSLAKVGKEVGNLSAKLPLEDRAAALEKFFNIMGQLIKQEAENVEDTSLETDFTLDDEALEDEELQMSPDEGLPSSADDGDEDSGIQGGSAE